MAYIASNRLDLLKLVALVLLSSYGLNNYAAVCRKCPPDATHKSSFNVCGLTVAPACPGTAVTPPVITVAPPVVTAPPLVSAPLPPVTPISTVRLGARVGKAVYVDTALSDFIDVDPTSFTLTGVLPNGLSMDSATGLISGTADATSAGKSYNFSITANNAAGSLKKVDYIYKIR